MFRVHQAKSQKYLNEKDLLFGFFTWRDFMSKFIFPLGASGLYANFSDGGVQLLLFVFLLLAGLVSFIEYFLSRDIQSLLLIRFFPPRAVNLSHRDLRVWRSNEN